MDNYYEEIHKVIPVLKEGGVILYPTDTIWGLGCDALNAAAIERIFQIKHRSHNKSMIILARDRLQISEYVKDPSPDLLREMETTKSPTTAIFENARNLPPNLVNENGSIAIRIPSDDFCLELLAAFQQPIVSTSANISEHASPQNFSEIDPVLPGQVDYTVFHRRNDNTKKAPSHIIRLDKNGTIERIR